MSLIKTLPGVRDLNRAAVPKHKPTGPELAAKGEQLAKISGSLEQIDKAIKVCAEGNDLHLPVKLRNFLLELHERLAGVRNSIAVMRDSGSYKDAVWAFRNLPVRISFGKEGDAVPYGSDRVPYGIKTGLLCTYSPEELVAIANKVPQMLKEDNFL